jgi:hypothetical protein
VFPKKSIQLESVSKAYNKDLMYLKRDTKFLPDQSGLKTSPAAQNSKSFSVHMNVRSNHFAKWIFQKMVEVGYAFFPQKWTNLIVMTIWSYSSKIENKSRSKSNAAPAHHLIDHCSPRAIFVGTRAATTQPPLQNQWHRS